MKRAPDSSNSFLFCIGLQQFLDKYSRNIQPPPQIHFYEHEKSADIIGREGYSLSIYGDAQSKGLQTF